MNNPNPQITHAVTTTQEVLVRTLSSDATSLEHGAQAPAPLQMTASRAPVLDEASIVPKQHRWVRTLLIMLAIGALGFLAYQYVYPKLVGPAVIQ